MLLNEVYFLPEVTFFAEKVNRVLALNVIRNFYGLLLLFLVVDNLALNQHISDCIRVKLIQVLNKLHFTVCFLVCDCQHPYLS